MQNLTIQEGKFDEILSYNSGNITFTITNYVTHKKKSGELVKDYTTHLCKAYGKNAEYVQKQAKTDDIICVIGSYIDSQYKRKGDGKFASEKHILCRSVYIKN